MRFEKDLRRFAVVALRSRMCVMTGAGEGWQAWMEFFL